MTDVNELDRLEALLNTLGEARPAWQAQAACRGAGADAFFPERGENYLGVLRICSTCPVREQCLDFGINEKDGVWGGLTGRQRRKLRRRRLLESAAHVTDKAS